MPEPTYTQPQIALAVAFACIAIILVAVFGLVALASRRDLPLERVRRVAYAIRPRWLAFLAAILTAGVVVALFHMPYSKAAGPVRVVRVTGGQFYWSVSPPSVPAGTTARLLVTGNDVNHALGLYGPDGDLLGVVQAMPGYTNRLDIRLDDAGTYLISCLEFCGLNHHRMSRTFQVTRRRG